MHRPVPAPNVEPRVLARRVNESPWGRIQPTADRLELTRLRFGAYYPTYGAMPLKNGTMFVYPGEKEGDIDIETMHVVEVQTTTSSDRRQVLAELEPFIREEGYLWWLSQQGIKRKTALALTPEEFRRGLDQFWTIELPQQTAKGRPEPAMLQRFKAGQMAERDHVLGWVVDQWARALQAQILDTSREVPYLPFAPREKQLQVSPSSNGKSHLLQELTPKELAQLRQRWSGNAEARAKLAKAQPGDFFGFVESASSPGSSDLRYLVEIKKKGYESRLVPDPWSTYQPRDVHGPSEVRDLNFNWSAEANAFWNEPKHVGRLALQQVHIGTFTKEGTYKAALAKLKAQKEAASRNGERFAFTGIQLKPLSEFAGHWNWGYDGTYYFAPENAYGPPEDLQALVNWCQENRLAVVFDLVLNHFGPEGNYLGEYGGRLFDAAGQMGSLGGNYRWDNPLALEQAKQVVRFWVENFHADGIRFDLSQEIPDYSMQEICKDAHKTKSNIGLIYEDYRPDDRVTLPPNIGIGGNLQYNGWGWHAWKDFVEDQARRGVADLGAFYRAQFDGLKGAGLRPLESGLNYLINHDILGNDWRERLVTRMKSLTPDVAPPGRAADLARMGAVLHQLMPGSTLSFQGEDEGQETELNFFTSFFQLDANLGVFLGRGAEAKPEFEPGRPGSIGPDAFLRSKSNSVLSGQEIKYRRLFHEALALRNRLPALWQGGREGLSFDNFYPDTAMGKKLLKQHRENNILLFSRQGRKMPVEAATSAYNQALFTPGNDVMVVANFSDTDQPNLEIPFPGGSVGWREVLNTDNPALGGQDKIHSKQPGIREDHFWGVSRSMINLPARTLVVFAKGDPGVTNLAGPTLTTEDADGKLNRVPEQSEEAKRMLRNQFVLV